MNKISILYGSQYGNSEAIAKDIQETFESMNLEVTCQTLNSVKDMNFKDSTLIILCSTTGNGDSPDNAIEFWNKIKKRTLEKDYFKDTNYSILALGDTNFNNFCHFGIMMDKRILELRGNRILELTCINDSNEPNKSIERWKNKLLCVITKLIT